MAKVDFPKSHFCLSFLLLLQYFLFEEFDSFTFNSHTFLAMH